MLVVTRTSLSFSINLKIYLSHHPVKSLLMKVIINNLVNKSDLVMVCSSLGEVILISIWYFAAFRTEIENWSWFFFITQKRIIYNLCLYNTHTICIWYNVNTETHIYIYMYVVWDTYTLHTISAAVVSVRCLSTRRYDLRARLGHQSHGPRHSDQMSHDTSPVTHSHTSI